MINLLVSLNVMFCDIKGSVENPGVYPVNNSNINDVIKLAGGLKKDANVININLSKIVTDEMVIYIPSKGEKPKLCPECICPIVEKVCDRKLEHQTANTTKIITTTKSITEKTTNHTTKIVPKTEITTTIKKEPEIININIANKEELLTISGIGEVIAERIIEYRENNIFLEIEDLLNIKGIGEILFAKIKDLITV